MDSKELVGAVLLDLGKAFNLVDHSLLLSKISMYHTDNTSLRWVESYLHDQTQRCCINGSLSDTLPITQGIPQGKSQQSKSLVLAKQDGPKSKEDKIATSWNQAKTFLLYKPNQLNLSLRGTEIKEAMNKKLLRVKIDKHLHWNSHIDYMITKLDSRVNLKRARKYLNLSLRNLLYNAYKTNFRILLFSVGKH